MKLVTLFALGIALIGLAIAADTKVKMESLPPAVQAAVTAQTKSATLVGLSKEVEKGKTTYEVETKVNGKTRDLLLDATGKLVEVEEETDINSIPAAARQAIQKKPAGGTVKRVETLTRGSSVSYEAAIQKNSKNSEVNVNADGSVHK